MANSSAVKKIQAAKALRSQTKGMRSQSAVQAFKDAADRLEDQAAKQVARTGRKPKKRKTLV